MGRKEMRADVSQITAMEIGTDLECNAILVLVKVVLDTLNLDRRYRYKIQVVYLKNHKMYL